MSSIPEFVMDAGHVGSEDCELTKFIELLEDVDLYGVSIINDFKKRLERWQEAEMNFAITGDSGAGKSSFIHSLRE